MIILEGPDGTGKTMLALKIANALNLEYVKIPRHKNDTEVDGFKFYMQWAEKLPANCVVDRFHIGESVYPQLYSDDFREPLKMWEQHAIERLLQARGCLLVHVIANYDFIETQYVKRCESFNLTDVIKENDLFAMTIFNSLLFKKTYITTHTNETLFIEFLEKYHTLIMNKVANIKEFKGVGSMCYPIMIVGEQVNKKYKTEYSFHTTNGCSPYLHHALDIAGCRNNYYITNAHKCHSENDEILNGDDIAAILKENFILSPIIRIALGHTADKLLQMAGLPHKTIKHPAHHMRFHHDVYAYAHLFNEVII